MMRRKRCIYKWLIAILLIASGLTETTAAVYTQTAQPASWGNNNMSAFGGTTTTTATTPTFQFRSTYAYSMTVGTSVYTSTIYAPEANYSAGSGPRRAGYWNEDGEWVEGDPEGNPIGEVPDPAPLGEPLALLAFALLYALLRYLRPSRIFPLSRLSRRRLANS
jgi:hypothetical protein